MAFDLTFHGAAGTVTGSAYHVKTPRAKVLVDFGMFQGGKESDDLNRSSTGLNLAGLDAVLVTHAHLDHTGRLPLLVRAGFKGPVFCTEATIDTMRLILQDSAKVQAQDLVRTNRKRERAGDAPLEPLYALPEVEQLISQCQPVAYDATVPVAPGIEARFVEAGHLLGSASIQLRIQEENATRKLVFSGDLGPKGAAILRDAVGFAQADVVVMESTYGNRDHKPIPETYAEFEALVRESVESRSKILVPTFAVGRAQLLLYLLAVLFRRKLVPKFPVYVDSPMAIEATRIYARHLELFDEDFQALQQERPLAADLTTVQPVATADESKALNDCSGPCLIMAGSGMCTAGRILHHLKQNLWREGTRVIIVGFQPDGSLGRQLVDRAPTVSIFGERIVVRAKVHTLGGFSAHAGQTELLNWLAPMAAGRPRVILTHGETKAREALADRIAELHGLRCEKPMQGDTLSL